MNSQLTVWQVIEGLGKLAPFSKSKVENQLSITLSEYDHPSNDAFRFFKGGRTGLANGVIISNVDLRLKREEGHPGFLVLELQGTCVDIKEVRQHFERLEITHTPRGRSPDDVTSHSAQRAWGEISFSFTERKPDCVSSIAFEPNKT